MSSSLKASETSQIHALDLLDISPTLLTSKMGLVVLVWQLSWGSHVLSPPPLPLLSPWPWREVAALALGLGPGLLAVVRLQLEMTLGQ